MTNIEQWAKGVVPDQFALAGVALRPLSLGHWVALARIGSPFVLGGDMAQAGLGDLTAAVLVCSNPWDSAWRAFGGGAAARWRRWWVSVRLSVDFEASLAGFVEWLRLQQAGPELWIDGATGGESRGAPHVLVLVTTLMKGLGLGYREALSLSMAEALWLHWAAQEDEGGIRIVSDADKQLLAEAEGIKDDPARYEALVAQFAHVTGSGAGKATHG
jgi:hypothetical protein